MQETSNLAERLRRQMQEESETIQDLTQQQLTAMRKELNGILQRELNTIKADINAQTSNIGWSMVKNRVLWPLMIGLTLSLGIFSGSWATMQYLSSEIQTMQATVSKLEKDGGKIQFNNCTEKDNTRHLCIKVDQSLGAFGKKSEWMVPEGY